MGQECVLRLKKAREQDVQNEQRTFFITELSFWAEGILPRGRRNFSVNEIR